MATGLGFPNGIVLRTDGKELLVGESFRNQIVAYPVLAPGELGAPRVFVKLPEKGERQIDNQPDGIALDEHGNLYVAHYGMKQVQAISPAGELIRRYPGGNMTTSNIAFAGPRMDQLYLEEAEERGRKASMRPRRWGHGRRMERWGDAPTISVLQ